MEEEWERKQEEIATTKRINAAKKEVEREARVSDSIVLNSDRSSRPYNIYTPGENRGPFYFFGRESDSRAVEHACVRFDGCSGSFFFMYAVRLYAAFPALSA